MWIQVSDRLPPIDPQKKTSRFVPVYANNQETWGRVEERLDKSAYWICPMLALVGELPTVTHWFDLPPLVEKANMQTERNKLKPGDVLVWAKDAGVRRMIVAVHPTGYTWRYLNGESVYRSEDGTDPFFERGWHLEPPEVGATET
jgi:hypothetical protein